MGRLTLAGAPPTARSCPTVENQAHCDFVKLRNMLIRTHMHDLKDVTCDVHYENYRAHCIQQMTRCAIPQTWPRTSWPQTYLSKQLVLAARPDLNLAPAPLSAPQRLVPPAQPRGVGAQEGSLGSGEVG